MVYPSVQVKPDDPSINRFFYLSQTTECGEVINPAFPVAEKNPSPKYCKNCRDKARREEIEAEAAARQN